MLVVSDEQPKTDYRGEKGRNGGRRVGAGRPPGAKDRLPRGALGALKALRHRIPEGTSKPLAAVADEALQAVVDVMRGEWIAKGAQAKLQAAALIREEVCGPIPKKTELSGPEGEPLKVTVNVLPPEEP